MTLRILRYVSVCSIAVVLLFVATGLVGCGGGSSNTPASPVPNPNPYDGNYGGLTSDNQPINFTIANNVVTAYSFRILVSPGATQVTYNGTSTAPVSSTGFNFQASSSTGPVVTISASFSGNTMSGSLSYPNAGQTSTVTFTATP